MSESESTNNSDDYDTSKMSEDTKPSKEDLKCNNSDKSDSEEDDDENMLNYHVIDEVPIDIPETEQKPTISSWPTLQILPGGVINPDQEQYPMSIYHDDKLLYACALCPEKFPLLSNLTRHIRWHEVKKRIEDGTDLSRLSAIEREFICIKRAKWDFDKQHKVEKLQIMKRVKRKKTIQYVKLSYKDMARKRSLENSRKEEEHALKISILEAEHACRMKTTKELHEQMMKVLLLKEKFLEKKLNGQ